MLKKNVNYRCTDYSYVQSFTFGKIKNKVLVLIVPVDAWCTGYNDSY